MSTGITRSSVAMLAGSFRVATTWIASTVQGPSTLGAPSSGPLGSGRLSTSVRPAVLYSIR